MNDDNFTNDTIDLEQLPRFAQVSFTALHPNYWKVVLIRIAITFTFVFSAIAALSLWVEPFSNFLIEGIAAGVFLLLLTITFSRVSFRRSGYAFREHDVVFRNGVVATTTKIIPYNRIQHVSLHEGAISRYFKLADIKVFTAGAVGGDLEIPGIPKELAEDIKQLLMGKIQKVL